jgi:hypothetical protein
MSEQRHQVFVSSTYQDLIEERSEVMQALLELECMPAGMELFPAANDTQWEWIKRVIDESDYYIVIVGGRYGSISKESGLSFTEMEYRYAIETQKPVMGFLIDDPLSLPSKVVEQQPGRVKKLEAFREMVKSRLCKYYSSPTDLGAKVSRSLTQLRKQYPRPGWLRAEVLATLPSSDEVLRLKTENEEMRRRLESYGLEEPTSRDHLASGTDEYELDFVFTISEKYEETGRYRITGDQWEKVTISWDTIFALLGPDILQTNNKYWSASQALASFVQRYVRRDLAKKHPGSRFSNFRVSSACVDTIMLQLRALKLFVLDEEKRWQITPYGDNYLVSLLGVLKGNKR